MKRSYFILDLVRFAAALLVMFYHLTYQGWLASADDPIAAITRNDLREVGAVFAFGWVGVPIFFVLSGFVIAFSADSKTAGEFIRGRSARLYPAAWICATITALVIANDPILIEKYMRSLTLMPIGPWVDPVYWTLAIELVFYSMIACVLALLGSKRLTQVGIVLGAASSCYWLLRLADFAAGHHFRSFFALFEGEIGGLFLLSHGCFFSLGMILWSIDHKGLSRSKLITAIVCVVACLISTTASARFHVLEYHEVSMTLVAAPAIWSVAVCAIVFATFWSMSDWPNVKAVQRYCRIVGLATYPTYLLHNIAGLALMRVLQPIGTSFALYATVMAILLASFLIVYLERFPRRLLIALLSRLPGESAPRIRHSLAR